jgi:RNA polymerase sigma-70 factor (ECF subfamily)
VVQQSVKAAQGQAPSIPPSFDEWYREYFHFVWRSARRLGVALAELDDAVQDVFIVVHRQLCDYEPRHSPRAWLFAITRRVAADHRRTVRRKGGLLPLREADTEGHRDDPLREAMNNERSDVILAFLSTVDDERREAFILYELEQLSAPDIAHAISVNLRTVYSRIRLAREAFAHYVETHYPELMGDADG